MRNPILFTGGVLSAAASLLHLAVIAGGPAWYRFFGAGEGMAQMAERGFLIRNDQSLALGQTGQELYLGVDHGRVGGPSAELLVGRHLTGAVIGLRGRYQGLSYDVFVGGPLDKPENFQTHHRTAGFNLTLSF